MIKIGHVNEINSGVTITTNSEVAAKPVANIYHYWKSKKYRTTGDAAEWIKIDMGSATDVDLFALVGHNLTSAATVKIQANATDAWGAPTVDVTVTYHADILIYIWAATQSYRWWRISLVDAANPAGYIEVGHAFLGAVWEPSRSFSGFTLIPSDPSVISESDDGAEMADVKTQYVDMGLAFRNVTIEDWETLRKAIGLTSRFYIVPDYDNAIRTDGRHDLSRYGRLASISPYPLIFQTRYDVSIIFHEARQ